MENWCRLTASSTVTLFSGPLLECSPDNTPVSPDSQSLRASRHRGLPASPPYSRLATAPLAGWGGCGWQKEWPFGSRGVDQQEKNRKLAPLGGLPSGSLTQTPASGTRLRPKAPNARPGVRGRGGAALECGRLPGALGGWALRAPGGPRSPGVKTRSPRARAGARSDSRVGAGESRRSGRKHAHLYWSNLAYTAHSAGLLS